MWTAPGTGEDRKKQLKDLNQYAMENLWVCRVYAFEGGLHATTSLSAMLRVVVWTSCGCRVENLGCSVRANRSLRQITLHWLLPARFDSFPVRGMRLCQLHHSKLYLTPLGPAHEGGKYGRQGTKQMSKVERDWTGGRSEGFEINNPCGCWERGCRGVRE